VRDAAQVNAVAREIERYLDAHPDAADTIDGVMQWWLPATSAAVPRVVVERALTALVEKGQLASRTLVDGSVIYARRRY
jgi:hypothetical protein